MLNKATILIAALLSLTLGGCGGYHQYEEVKDADLVEVSYDAVDELQDRLTQKLPKNSLIVVSTLLNVDNRNKTSAFGRIVSDQIASAFQQSGHQIIGMEMPIDLFTMKEDGSLQLSDEIKTLLGSYRAGTLVGGVYAPGKKNTYVSLRIVDLVTKTVISSNDFSVPMGPDAKLLVKPKDLKSTKVKESATDATEESDDETSEETDEANTEPKKEEQEKEPDAPEILDNY